MPHDLRRSDVIAFTLLGIVVVGLGTAIAYLVSRHGVMTGHGRLLFGAPSYARLADELIEHRGFAAGGEALDRMPLYVAVVALSKLIAGSHWAYALIILQGALALLCGTMLHRAVRGLTSVSWAPAVVTAGYALHIGLQLENFALRETVLYEFFVVSFFYFATRTITSRTVALMVLCVGLAFYTRPTGVLLIVPLSIFILMMPAASLRHRLKTLGWALAAMVLLAAPWQAYQSHVQGRFTLSATHVGGWNLYKGNSFAFEAVSPYIDHDQADGYVEGLREQYRSGQLSTRAAGARSEDDYLRRLAQADIRADYPRFLRKTVLRVIVYLSPLETPLGAADVGVDRDRVVLNHYRGNFVDADRDWIDFLGQLSFFIVLFAIPLGFLGALRFLWADARLRAVAAASFAVVAVHVAAHAALTAETRYRLPLDPLFLLWAGATLGLIFGTRPQGARP
ncbi:MAG TPA: hypothetical protein VHV81_10735 [Steroidobacteraceae bacterium]|nr:hypothetical protein [Steroidobacteraceae bacterium]